MTTTAEQRQYSSRSGQRGAVLLVAMLFLVVMTIIGTTALTTTRMEEKMAGNSRDLNLAFQAAEAALRAGELFVQNNNIPAFYDNCSNGFCSYADGTLTPRWLDATLDIWANGSGRHIAYSAFSPAATGIETAPKYIIEELPVSVASGGGQSLVKGFKPPPIGKFFTVVARGSGGTDAAQVFLRSIFRK